MKHAGPVAAALSLILAAGCARQAVYRQPGLDVRRGGVVAIIPFENMTSDRDAGLKVAELFLAELYARAGGDVELLPAEDVAERLRTLEGQAAPTHELGEMLGAQLLVVGRVTEYDYKHGLGEDPVVSVSVRLLDARTGTVLWSGARSQVGRPSWMRQDSLSRLAQVVCARLAADMLAD